MGEREIAGGRGGTRVSLAYRWTGNIWKYRNCDNFIKEGSFIYLSFFFKKKLLRFFNFSFPIVERVWKNSFRSASRAKKRFDISTIFLSLSLFTIFPFVQRLHDSFLNTQVYFHFYLAALDEEMLRSLDSLFPHTKFLEGACHRPRNCFAISRKIRPSQLLLPFLLIESIDKRLSKYSFVSRVTVIEVSPKLNSSNFSSTAKFLCHVSLEG